MTPGIMTPGIPVVRATTQGGRVGWAVAATMLVLTAAAYWPGLRGGYAFDDFPNIVFNAGLHVTTLDWPAWTAAIFSSPASDLQRPLAMLTFAINHYFTGLDPAAMKLTNLGIHLVNALLVLSLVQSLLRHAGVGASAARRAWTARFVAAAWALHPINLMPVLFVVQRMESLAHTFVFAGLHLYLRGRQRQREGGNGWGLVGGGLLLGTALGVLAKESAVLLPLYAFCMELCLFGFRGRDGQRDRALYLVHATVLFLPALLGLAWLLPRVMAPGAFAFRDFTLGERLLTESRVVMDYLHWSVFPSLRELSLHHDDYSVSRGLWSPPSTLFALLGLAALVATATWACRRRPLIGLGLMWFLGAQLLTATVIPLELVYEHRNYFASLGICLVIADLLLLAPATAGQRRIGAVLATLALTAFALTTHLRAREWSDPLRFAMTEAAKHPRSPRATYTLGQVLVMTSGYDRESALFESGREALERARRVQGSGILPHSSLLLLAANTGQPDQAVWWDEMEQRLRSNPIGPQEINAIGSLARCARERDCVFPQQRMIAMFDAAASHGPNAEVLSIYGDYLLNILHQPQPALRMWRESVAAAPRHAQYRVNLIKLLIHLGDYDEARTQIDQLHAMGLVGQHVQAATQMEDRLRAVVADRERASVTGQ